MNKILIIVAVAAIVLFLVGLFFLTGMNNIYGKTSFKDRYSSISKLTFSVGKGSILKQAFNVYLSYKNQSRKLQSANKTVTVKDFSWPKYHMCIAEEGAAQNESCYDVPFTLIALPKELIGVDSVEVPLSLGKFSSIKLKYYGRTKIDTPWGSHLVANYTNLSVEYPRKGMNTTTLAYFDYKEGYLVRIEVSVTNGNLTSTAIFKLIEPPQLHAPIQIEKPEKWIWGSG